MKWKKLGKIFSLEPSHPQMLSHAANPLAVHLNDDIFRIFFSTRDAYNKSSVSFVDIDIIKRIIIFTNKAPIFYYGPKNSFYSDGVSIGNIYLINAHVYMLFMGWQVKDEKHWRGDIGRLSLKNDEELSLEPLHAFLESDKEDPISLSYPWVLRDGNLYKMWYGSTITWDAGNGEMIHTIKYATSKDGNKWDKHGIAIPYEINVAQAFSRPNVIKDQAGYHMWYSFRSGRGEKYRIGYAKSEDGEIWERCEDSGITVSNSGWDSEMICYPFVFDHKSERYMLYNGNSYGEEGFGLAILQDNY